MKLNKVNRECLLSELDKAKEELTSQRGLLRTAKSDDTERLSGLWEIGCFLAEEKIKLIEKSLINNEIDF